MSANVKLNLLLINIIDLVISSLDMQKTHTDQIILEVLLLCLKRNVPKTFESNSCKKLFPKCVCQWYSLVRYILLHMIIGRQYSLLKFIFAQRFFATAMFFRSLKRVFQKMSVFYVRYLHKNIAILLIPKIQTKAFTS